MGSNDHYPEEAPAHPVTVDGFWMDQYTVTNAQFSRFIEQTKYVTSAERPREQKTIRVRSPNYLFRHQLCFAGRGIRSI
jgi:formylglycine-generating enzyme required for sulfatase activity